MGVDKPIFEIRAIKKGIFMNVDQIVLLILNNKLYKAGEISREIKEKIDREIKKNIDRENKG